ncbi:hypothetical protein NBRC110019_17600 [Neptunitalea chrysea]|uniref:Uncharacterized protein n=1 Tax=Neptunitalea chrysea TaxID=1647581 RepID=A0A9W6B543_9FLAO|nr:hypothetical protein [Neptunitalea chrysea]GLB52720.1 hypothetical protein NBRC110019_17600 [Neptunitalea chrysea]
MIQEGKKHVCTYDLSGEEKEAPEDCGDIFKNVDLPPLLVPQYISFFSEENGGVFYYLVATYNLRPMSEDLQPPELV